MSFVYGGYNPKAPNGTTGSSQEPATSATGRKFAVMPKLGLGGLGYSKPPPKPAAASQVPVVPAAASPTPTAAAATTAAASVSVETAVSTSTTVIKRETPSPAEQKYQPEQHTRSQQQQPPPQMPPSRHVILQQQQHTRHVIVQQQQQLRPQMVQQPHQPAYANQHNYAAQRPAGVVRPVMPMMRTGMGLGYGGAHVIRPVAVGYGAGSSYGSNNLSLNVPLREPTPEPEPVITQEMIIKEEYKIEEDYAVYGTVDDVDIQIRNVVCNYTLPLHIDLRRLAQNSNNVTFDRGRGVLLKQKRNPMCYVKIYSSGKVYIVGCRSEVECMTAARRIARNVQRAMNKLGEEVRIRNYRVCNVLATCKMPFGVKVEEVAKAHPAESQYEPELSVGLVWRNKEPKATLRIHTTGSVTVTGAQSEADVYTVIARLYPILLQHKCPPRAKGEMTAAAKRKRETAAMKREYSRHSSAYGGPHSKMSRVDSGVVGGRVVFSDEEDEDDIYDDVEY